MFKRIERTAQQIGSGLELRIWPDVDERVPVIGCHSEVLMHMGLAGKPIEVALVRNRYMNGEPVEGECLGRLYVAQVYVDGEPFSAPILTGEAGFYEEPHVGFYTYGDINRITTELIET